MMEKGFGYKKCGIYKISNINNNKFYIGSSKHIYYRLRRHYSELRKNKHPNAYLQNSFNKHTEKAFTICIIEECSEEDLSIREQWYIDNLLPTYNITREVIRNTPSLESRQKIRNTLLKQKEDGTLKYPLHEDKWNHASIYDLNCNLLFQGKSRSEAGQFLLTLYPDLKVPNLVVSLVIRKNKRYKNHLIFNSTDICHFCEKQDSNNQTKVIITDVINNIITPCASITKAALLLQTSISGVEKAIKFKRFYKKQYLITKDEN